MYYIYLSILIFASGLFTSFQQQDPVRIMSYNIRYDNPGDGLNSWDHRKDRIANQIKFYEPDFVGIQEGLVHQVRFLEEQLPHMERIGVGRDDGKEGGEFSALFYNTNRFELVPGTEQTYWLSETPSKPSKSWDAALPRIVTFGKFRNKNSGQELYVFNTHFDHRGVVARAESAKLILKTIEKVAGELPVVLTGDFNIVESSEPYRILTESFLSDAYYTSVLPSAGPSFTFSGFELPLPENTNRIDFIFVNEQVQVLKHAIIADFRDGRFPSDHLPVVADVRVEE